MAPHSSTLAWKIPWMEESGRLQSMGSLRVGHDWAIYFHFSLSCIGEGNGNPLQCSCLENPRDVGAWWTAVYGVAQSRTRLKRLSSSSSSVWDATVSFGAKCAVSKTWGILMLSLWKGASLIAQLVKNLSAMLETLVQFLGQEDLLEKG